ncbi:MAG TPA: hypothetical protein VF484_10755, partial [Candidatus Limnocylindrales bacterium]
MERSRGRRAGACAGVLGLAICLSGCLSTAPSLEPTQLAVVPSPTVAATLEPTGGPSPAPTTQPTFPLAVVTGLTNPRVGITLAELTTLATRGDLVRPCNVDVLTPSLPAPPPGQMSGSHPPCVAADAIAALLQQQPSDVALLPPGLVEPATKTLPIDGTGPYGLFGADLFGDPAMRAIPYPITGRATAGVSLDA